MSTHMVSPPCVSWTRVIFCVFSKWQYYHALDHFLFIAHGTACRFKGKYVHTFSKLKKVIRKKLLIGLSKTKMIFWGSCQEKAPLSEALTWAKLKQKVTFAADLRGRRRKANTHNSTTHCSTLVLYKCAENILVKLLLQVTFCEPSSASSWCRSCHRRESRTCGSSAFRRCSRCRCSPPWSWPSCSRCCAAGTLAIPSTRFRSCSCAFERSERPAWTAPRKRKTGSDCWVCCPGHMTTSWSPRAPPPPPPSLPPLPPPPPHPQGLLDQASQAWGLVWLWENYDWGLNLRSQPKPRRTGRRLLCFCTVELRE